MASMDDAAIDSSLRSFFQTHTLQDVVNGSNPPVVLDAETPLYTALESLRATSGPCVLVQNAHTNRLIGAIDWSDALHYSIAALDAAAASQAAATAAASAAASGGASPLLVPTPNSSDDLDLAVPIKHVTGHSGGTSLVCFHATASLSDVMLHLSSGLRYVCVLSPAGNNNAPSHASDESGAVSGLSASKPSTAPAGSGSGSGSGSASGSSSASGIPSSRAISPPPVSRIESPTPPPSDGVVLLESSALAAAAKPILNRRRSGSNLFPAGTGTVASPSAGPTHAAGTSTPVNTPQAPLSRLVVVSNRNEFSIAATAAAANAASLTSPQAASGSLPSPTASAAVRGSPQKGRSSRATTSTNAATAAALISAAIESDTKSDEKAGSTVLSSSVKRGRAFSLTDSAHSQAIAAAAAQAAASTGAGAGTTLSSATAGYVQSPDLSSGSISSSTVVAAVVTQSDVLRFVQSKYQYLQAALDRTLAQMNVAPVGVRSAAASSVVGGTPVLDRRKSGERGEREALISLNPKSEDAGARRLSASPADISIQSAIALANSAAASKAPPLVGAKLDYCSIELAATNKPVVTLAAAIRTLLDSQKESLCVTENGKLIHTFSMASFADVLKHRRISLFSQPLRTFMSGGVAGVVAAANSAAAAAAAATTTAVSPSIFSPSPVQGLSSPPPPVPVSGGASPAVGKYHTATATVLSVHPAEGKTWLDSGVLITGGGGNSPGTGNSSVASSIASTASGSGGSQSARGSRTDTKLEELYAQHQTAHRNSGSSVASNRLPSPALGPQPTPADRKGFTPLSPTGAAAAALLASPPKVPALPLPSSAGGDAAPPNSLPVLPLDENAPSGPLLRFRRRSSGPDTPNPEYRILHRTRDSTIEVPATTKPTSRPPSNPPSPSKAKRMSGGGAGGGGGGGAGSAVPASPTLMPIVATAISVGIPVSGTAAGAGSAGAPQSTAAAVAAAAVADSTGVPAMPPFGSLPMPALITVPVHSVPEAITIPGFSGLTASGGSGGSGSDKLSLNALPRGAVSPASVQPSFGHSVGTAWSYGSHDSDRLPPAVTPAFSLRQAIALMLATNSDEVCVVDSAEHRRPILTVSATRVLKLLCPPLNAALMSPQPNTSLFAASPAGRRGSGIRLSPGRTQHQLLMAAAPPFQL